MEKQHNWITHIEFITLVVSILGSAFLLWGHIDSQVAMFHETTMALRVDMQVQMQAQSARTDKLYEMFIDLVKETRNKPGKA